MKKYITLLFLFFFLLGCKTTRPQSVKTDSVVENRTKADRRSDSLSVKRTNEFDLNQTIESYIMQLLYERSAQLDRQETEYDTEKPVIPETGKPPVKKETNTNITEKETNQEIYFRELIDNILRHQQELDSIVASMNDNSRYDIKEVNTSEIKESKRIPVKMAIFLAVGILSVGLFFWIRKKFF